MKIGEGEEHRAEGIEHRAPSAPSAGIGTDAAGLVRRRERSRTVLTTN